MKIRIKGNSLRYRLTQIDVAALAQKGYLAEETHFAGGAFGYALKIADSAAITADYTNHAITLVLPAAMLTELAETDKVGFAATYGQLHLLVEKDFTCLDNVEEDQSDNYPNPLAIKPV